MYVINPTGVHVSLKQSEYSVRESDGRVAITIQAARRYYYSSFYVKIRARVNTYLRPYGMWPYVRSCVRYTRNLCMLIKLCKMQQFCIYNRGGSRGLRGLKTPLLNYIGEARRVV